MNKNPGLRQEAGGRGQEAAKEQDTGFLALAQGDFEF
jgi:hypothetical protein